MAAYKLLTVGNPKTLKGEAYGYLTGVLHLAPADVAGVGTVCPMATEGCKAACLNTAGRGGIGLTTRGTNAIQEARIRRTRQYRENPGTFHAALSADVETLIRDAAKHGLKPAVRVNGTSDLPALAVEMARRFPAVQFYDYTKLPVWNRLGTPANLHYTFSRSERNAMTCMEALTHGLNVAIVFAVPKRAALPTTFNGVPVIDGDTSDLRFLDPPGVVVGLRAKGRAKADATGFVVRDF